MLWGGFPWLLWASRSGVRCPHPTGVVVLLSGLSALQELLQPWKLLHIPLNLGMHCSVAHGFGEHNSYPGVCHHSNIMSSPVCCALQVVSITTCPGAM